MENLKTQAPRHPVYGLWQNPYTHGMKRNPSSIYVVGGSRTHTMSSTHRNDL